MTNTKFVPLRMEKINKTEMPERIRIRIMDKYRIRIELGKDYDAVNWTTIFISRSLARPTCIMNLIFFV